MMIITYPRNLPSEKENIEIEYFKMDGYHILYHMLGFGAFYLSCSVFQTF